MNKTWVHYEICIEDERGLDPFGLHYSTRREAENELKIVAPDHPTAFIITVIKTRCGVRSHGGLQQRYLRSL